jgi:hypothetical protein
MSEIETRIKHWQNVAKSFPDMRYPLYNIRLGSTLTTSVHPFIPAVSLYLETFVQNDGGTRIVLVADHYTWNGQYTPEELEHRLKHFIDKCELTKEKHIFNARHSIREPYDFNK